MAKRGKYNSESVRNAAVDKLLDTIPNEHFIKGVITRHYMRGCLRAAFNRGWQSRARQERAKRKQLEEALRQARAALEFYAEPENIDRFIFCRSTYADVELKAGVSLKAREALAALGPAKKGREQ